MEIRFDVSERQPFVDIVLAPHGLHSGSTEASVDDGWSCEGFPQLHSYYDYC